MLKQFLKSISNIMHCTCIQVFKALLYIVREKNWSHCSFWQRHSRNWTFILKTYLLIQCFWYYILHWRMLYQTHGAMCMAWSLICKTVVNFTYCTLCDWVGLNDTKYDIKSGLNCIDTNWIFLRFDIFYPIQKNLPIHVFVWQYISIIQCIQFSWNCPFLNYVKSIR